MDGRVRQSGGDVSPHEHVTRSKPCPAFVYIDPSPELVDSRCRRSGHRLVGVVLLIGFDIPCF
ncbi:MAG: hypothetical protein MZV63_63305 [Marinilabiliales bacterium]|nr:hypothetical protein [Marinilabiliales bacterium]